MFYLSADSHPFGNDLLIVVSLTL